MEPPDSEGVRGLLQMRGWVVGTGHGYRGAVLMHHAPATMVTLEHVGGSPLRARDLIVCVARDVCGAYHPSHIAGHGARSIV
jgi:hypothetical protein